MSKNTIDPKRYSWIDHSWAKIVDEYKNKDSAEIAEKIMEDLFVAQVDTALSVTSLNTGMLQVNSSCKLTIKPEYQDRYVIKIKFIVYGSGTSNRTILTRKEEVVDLPGGCQLIEWNVGCLSEHLYNLHNTPYIKSSSFIEEHTVIPTNTNGKGKYQEAVGNFTPLRNVYKTSLYGYRSTSGQVINPGLMMYTRNHRKELGSGVYQYDTGDYMGSKENVINWSTQGVSMIALGGWDESDNGEISWENESTIKLKTKNKTSLYTVPSYGECLVLRRSPATLTTKDFDIPEDYYPDKITEDNNDTWPYPWLMLAAHDWLDSRDQWNLEVVPYCADPLNPGYTSSSISSYGVYWRNAQSYVLKHNDFFKDNPKQASCFFAKKHIDLKYAWKQVPVDTVINKDSFKTEGSIITHPMHSWFDKGTNVNNKNWYYNQVWYKPNDFYATQEKLAPWVDSCIWLGLFPSLSKHAVVDIVLAPGKKYEDHHAVIEADAKLQYVLDFSPVIVLPHETDTSDNWITKTTTYYCSDHKPSDYKNSYNEGDLYRNSTVPWRFIGSQTVVTSKWLNISTPFYFDMFAGPTNQTMPWPMRNICTDSKPAIVHVPWFYDEYADLEEGWKDPNCALAHQKCEFAQNKIKTGVWGFRDFNADQNIPPTYTTIAWRCPFQWNRHAGYQNVDYQSHWITFPENYAENSYGLYWVDSAIHHWSKDEFIKDFGDNNLNIYINETQAKRPARYQITNTHVFANFSSTEYHCGVSRSQWSANSLPALLKKYTVDTTNGLGINSYDWEDGDYPASEQENNRTVRWSIHEDNSLYPPNNEWRCWSDDTYNINQSDLKPFDARCYTWYSRDAQENYHFNFSSTSRKIRWNKNNIDIMYRPDYDYQSLFIYNWSTDPQYLRIIRNNGQPYTIVSCICYDTSSSNNKEISKVEHLTPNDCIIIAPDCWAHIKFEELSYDNLRIINDSEGITYNMTTTPTYCMLLVERVHYTSSDPYSEALTFNKKYANLIEISDDGWNWRAISEEESNNVFFTSPCAPLYLRGKLKDLKSPIKEPLFTTEHNWPLRLGGCLTNLVDYINPDDTIDAQLPNDVFNLMFDKCRIRHVDQNLLPFTNLSVGCYNSMFNNCDALVNAPTLPATQLAEKCYSNMFFYCTQLSMLPALPANQLPDECYARMFCGCQSIKISTSRTDEYRNEYSIPAIGNVISVGKSACENMWYNTGGTFTGDPEANESYYTSNDII